MLKFRKYSKNQEDLLPDDYFLDVKDDMLDYLELESKNAIIELSEYNNDNRKRAYTLLNYLLFGIGGSILLALSNYQNFHYVINILIIFLNAGWIISALNLIHRVLLSSDFPMRNTRPEKLYNQSFKEADDPNKLGVLRRYQLWNYNETVKDLKRINEKYGRSIDISITIAILTPVILIVIASIIA